MKEKKKAIYFGTELFHEVGSQGVNDALQPQFWYTRFKFLLVWLREINSSFSKLDILFESLHRCYVKLDLRQSQLKTEQHSLHRSSRVN